MRIRALPSVAFALLLVAGCQRAPAVTTAPVRHFSIVLEHSATGWAAHCETGCAWTDVSRTCVGCDARLDASGIAPGYPARAGTTGFEFVLSGERNGWTAVAVRGVTWETLSWTCSASTCRARIDETGVGRA